MARSSKGISLCQRKHALEVLEDAGLTSCIPTKTPMEQNLKLNKNQGKLLADPRGLVFTKILLEGCCTSPLQD